MQLGYLSGAVEALTVLGKDLHKTKGMISLRKDR